jgi:hypothetical protein
MHIVLLSSFDCKGAVQNPTNVFELWCTLEAKHLGISDKVIYTTLT